MKLFRMLALVVALVGVNAAFAETEELDINVNPGVCETQAEASDLASADWPRDHHHYIWHCQAYVNHGGHGHSHDAYSYNRWVAYRQALRSCEYYHGYGHCHVHCHLDHNH